MMSAATDLLSEETITAPKLGIAVIANLQGIVRADQIKINQLPVEARFKLKPISPPPEAP
jgi:hypothetical protein